MINVRHKPEWMSLLTFDTLNSQLTATFKMLLEADVKVETARLDANSRSGEESGWLQVRNRALLEDLRLSREDRNRGVGELLTQTARLKWMMANDYRPEAPTLIENYADIDRKMKAEKAKRSA